jgi:hypothetical protein
MSPTFKLVALLGRQIGLPVGALHDSKLADPVPMSVATGARAVVVLPETAVLIAVLVASPVGTAT